MSAMEILSSGLVSREELVGSKSVTLSHTLEDCRASVKSIFMGTSCYDLISQSTKTIVFETTIPFQMAFYALIEHDTAVAPLWDPATHAFVGMMTIADYLRALKLCRQENVSMLELCARSIADFIGSPKFRFHHAMFESIDVEDSVQNMCYFLNRYQCKFVPILNPDDSTLVGILGYLDLIHLLYQASKQHPELFRANLEDMRLHVLGRGQPALLSTPIISILMSDERLESSVPIVDENNVVIGIYHMIDMHFITKAADSEAVLVNMGTLTVNDVFKLQAQQQAAGEGSPLIPPLVTCTMKDRIEDVISVMMQARSSTVVVVDDAKRFRGMISIEDVVKYYLE